MHLPKDKKEKTIHKVPPAQNKRTQVREIVQEKIFPEARNLGENVV